MLATTTEGTGMKVLKGTIIIKIDPHLYQFRLDAGMTEVEAIHRTLDSILTVLGPEARKLISFEDCEITDIQENKLPF